MIRKLGLGLTSLLLVLAVSGCTTLAKWGFIEKSNLTPPAPLVNFKPELSVQRVWSVNAGYGTKKQNLKLLIADYNNTLITADVYGNVYAFDQTTGKPIWRERLGAEIMSGPSAGNGMVVVTNVKARAIALNAENGKPMWSQPIPNIALAAPAITGNQVIIKTIDGNMISLDTASGAQNWQFHHDEPTLILRGSSTPQVSSGKIVAGFADGQLVALDQSSGNMVWEVPVATPSGSTQIEQMVDIDADPYIDNGVVFVASYQGNLAAIALANGKPLWTHPISAYAGLIAGPNQVFVVDANSHVFAFSRSGGSINWEQTGLDSRNLTAPVAMDTDNAIVVGDGLGYVHWLAKSDGHFLARAYTDKTGIMSPPVVIGNTVYVITKSGMLSAYRVG